MPKPSFEDLSFNIVKYLNKMGGNRQHLRADARIAAFDQFYPQGTIANEIIERVHNTEVKRNEQNEVIDFIDNSYAIVKASVDTMGRAATGHKLGAIAGDGLEKTLTGATARAIRHVGINTKEVVERLIKKNNDPKLKDFLEEIRKGNSTYEYVNVDSRLLSLMEDYEKFTIFTEILDIDLKREYAEYKFDKNIKAHRWFTAFGYVCFRARLEFEDGSFREGIGSATGLELDGFHWFAKGETDAIGRALAYAGYGTLDAKEFKEDDISDAPVTVSGINLPHQEKYPDERSQPEVPVAPAQQTPKPQPKPTPKPEPKPQPKKELPQQPEPQPEAPVAMSNEACMAELKTYPDKLTKDEFAMMVDIRQTANPNLSKPHQTWSNEDWNYAVSIARHCMALKDQGMPTDEQHNRLKVAATTHKMRLLKELAGQMIGKELEKLSCLEMEYLLFKLADNAFFCDLASAIDTPEGDKTYPILKGTYKLSSPLEFIYAKKEMKKPYIEELFALSAAIDPAFLEEHTDKEITDFFASYGFHEEDNAA